MKKTLEKHVEAHSKRLKKQSGKASKHGLKILAAGDIHGDKQLAKALAERAVKEGVDLVILTGDLTFAEQSTEGIIGPFVKNGLKVLFIPGNHETIATADFLAQVYGPNAKNIHGYALIYKNIGIVGCGGANVGPNMLSEQEIFETLKQGFYSLKKYNLDKIVMITHVHPAYSKMEKLTTIFPGSKAVTKALKLFKPDLLLCSHVHEAEGLEEVIEKTRVINVGKHGKIIEL